MKKGDRKTLFGTFILVFFILLLYNSMVGSQWGFDSIMSIIVLVIFYYLDDYLDITYAEFIVGIIALTLHNLGSFDFYAFQMGFIYYDNIVHMVSSLALGMGFFRVFYTRFHIENREQLIALFLMSIGLVSLLGIGIETTEYAGHVFLGEGDGIFFTGVGDANKLGDPLEQYKDALEDLMWNFFGALIGATITLLRLDTSSEGRKSKHPERLPPKTRDQKLTPYLKELSSQPAKQPQRSKVLSS